MSKFKSAQRVRVYEYSEEIGPCSLVCWVLEANPDGSLRVMLELDDATWTVHEKQCRLLRPKKKDARMEYLHRPYGDV